MRTPMLRSSVAVVLVAAASALVGCAPPSPGDAVEGSSEAVKRGRPTTPRPAPPPSATPPTAPLQFGVFSRATFDPHTATVEEQVGFTQPGQHARVCYAYLDGTEDQKHACDNYPSGYLDLSCADATFGTASSCTGSRPIGAAPFDQGDGHYGVHFVDADSPALTKTVVTKIWSDRFLLSIASREVPALLDQTAPEHPIAEFDPFCSLIFSNACGDGLRKFPVVGGLDLTAEVRTDLADQLRVCFASYATGTMTTKEIDAKDDELLTSCAGSTDPVASLDGWTREEREGRTAFHFDAAPLLARGERLVMAFAVGGRVRKFVTYYVPGS